MRDTRGRRLALALAVSAAMALTSTGVVLGQEESPAPEASMAPSASPQPEVVTPSTLGMMHVATDKTAGTKLKGKKYAQAIAKAAPDAVRYLITTVGVDDIDRIIELSRAARAVDEAGDAKAAKALIDIATLLYRNEWTKTKTDPVALNETIEEVIVAGDYPDQDPALALWTYGDEGLIGLIDICFWSEGIASIYSAAEPSLCEDNKGRQLRVDFSLVDGAKNSTKDLYTGDPKAADAGGVGIHKVVQDKTANDKLAGKQYKKALAKALKKSGPAVASYRAGGSGVGPMNGIIDLVLLAREADEAGNAKAAKAFMALATASYRVAWTTEGLSPLDLNERLWQLVADEHPGEPALQVLPVGDDLHDVCHFTKKQLRKTGEEGDWAPNWANDPWLCDEMGGTVLRVTGEEVEWHYGGHTAKSEVAA